ncbi:hypothetical protein [Granulosicoccus antarcticus]|uniref:Uncharacterized protein n=1 Tax=Granulosicoccus antarcticus IMCC3135 TaxID=1192854 RepID=A0A2Z2NVF5_9GAMM|nr:hypothetical protein [Granulosicoccus antarcticus]ASJ71647.1 hypothetical protein IMCC3135_07710 [Granulosicoccus antarcticus IMCC3135]
MRGVSKRADSSEEHIGHFVRTCSSKEEVDVEFVQFFRQLVDGHEPELSSICELDTSQRLEFVKLLFQYGFYDQVIRIAENIELNEQERLFVVDVFEDRALMELGYLSECVGVNCFLYGALDRLANEDQCTIADFEDVGEDSLLAELKSMDFNTDLERFSKLYHYLFSKKEFRTDPFFALRKPAPLILKNHLHYLYEGAKLSGDFRPYVQACTAKNSDISDKLFRNELARVGSEFFESLSVASLQKLVRLFGLDYTLAGMRSVQFPQNLLVVQLFKAAAELRRSRRVTNFSQVSSSSPNPKNTALCISGQLRGAGECLPYWFEAYTKRGYSTFLTTWEEVGYPSGAEAGRLSRMLPDSLGPHFSNLSVEEFQVRYPTAFGLLQPQQSSREELGRILSSIGLDDESLSIRYLDECEIEERAKRCRGEVSRTHLNQIKMFFNMHSVRVLLEEHEREKGEAYEWVIWARPDFSVSKLELDEFKVEDHVYTSHVSDEGRMLDYCMIMRRDDLSVFSECYSNLMSSVPSPVFGYNHGPRLITDVFLSHGLSAMDIPTARINSDGLKAWRPKASAVYLALRKDIANLDRESQIESDLLDVLRVLESPQKASDCIGSTEVAQS